MRFRLWLLFCRRADHKLRLVEVATDDIVDDASEKKSTKTISASLLRTDNRSNFLPALGAQQHAMSNLYEPEPTALAKVGSIYQDSVFFSHFVWYSFCCCASVQGGHRFLKVLEEKIFRFLPGPEKFLNIELGSHLISAVQNCYAQDVKFFHIYAKII